MGGERGWRRFSENGKTTNQESSDQMATTSTRRGGYNFVFNLVLIFFSVCIREITYKGFSKVLFRSKLFYMFHWILSRSSDTFKNWYVISDHKKGNPYERSEQKRIVNQTQSPVQQIRPGDVGLKTTLWYAISVYLFHRLFRWRFIQGPGSLFFTINFCLAQSKKSWVSEPFNLILTPFCPLEIVKCRKNLTAISYH